MDTTGLNYELLISGNRCLNSLNQYFNNGSFHVSVLRKK
jgi:hypothetical protein